MRLRFLSLLFFAAPLLARAGECEDDFAQCQDDCMIQFGGSIREEMKAKFVKCVRKCGRTSNNCQERFTETKVNHLNEGALDKSPGSRNIDEDGMPILKKRPVDDRRDDLRDDLPAPERVAKAKTKKKPRDEVKDDEVIKSERTKLDADPPPKKVEPEPPALAPPVVKPKPEEPKPPPKKEEDHDDLRNY